MSKRRRSGSVSMYIPRNPVYRQDIAFSLATVGTGAETVTLFTTTAGVAGTLSFKKLRFSIKPVESIADNLYGATKYGMVLGLNRDSSSTGSLSLPAADSTSELYSQPNNVLWSQVGLCLPTWAYVPVSGASNQRSYSQGLDFDIDFKKLKRRVKPGDFLYIKCVTDGDGSNQSQLTFTGASTFYIKT